MKPGVLIVRAVSEWRDDQSDSMPSYRQVSIVLNNTAIFWYCSGG